MIVDFIPPGTDGRVYKAQWRSEQAVYQAVRLSREHLLSPHINYLHQLNHRINHENVISLGEIILEDKSS